MSEAADRQRAARRRSMLPGSARDRFFSVAKVALPILAGGLAAVLVALPLTITREFSFLLSKDSAARADERMRMTEASYRGETERGEPFLIAAQSGVQKSSAVPVVMLTGLSAEIERADGVARVTAPAGEFLMEENRVLVNGPIEVRSQSGFSLDGEAVEVDLNANRVRSDRPVSGEGPLGRFRSDRFEADLDARRLVMEGRVSMRIVQQ